jgi:hypothetical protein
MFAIPIAPTNKATAPSPSSSAVNWPFAAARASSAADGLTIWTGARAPGPGRVPRPVIASTDPR